jgi:hypothetical protein
MSGEIARSHLSSIYKDAQTKRWLSRRQRPIPVENIIDQHHLRLYQNTFDAIDLDCSGSIDCDELMHAFR